MKNLFLYVTLSMFAASAVFADTTTSAKASADKKSACCATTKDACCASKSACSKGMPKKTVLMSPKAMAEAGK